MGSREFNSRAECAVPLGKADTAVYLVLMWISPVVMSCCILLYSASIIGGRPMVVYPSTSSGSSSNTLQITVAASVAGTSWSPAVLLEGATSQKKQSSIMEVGVVTSACQ